MIAARLPALTIHTLLHDGPFAVVGYDKAMQVKIESILDGRTIDLGHQSASFGQTRAIDPDARAYREQLPRSLSGVFATSATNVNAELRLKRSQSALQRTNHARGYS